MQRGKSSFERSKRNLISRRRTKRIARIRRHRELNAAASPHGWRVCVRGIWVP